MSGKSITWVFQIIVAVILGQTLFFKFSATEESVQIFSQLGMEPYGRLGIGMAEFIAVVLLLIPRTAHWGALLALGLMSGALIAHATQLGFSGEMLSLSILAAIAWAGSLAVFVIRRKQFSFLTKD